MRGYSLRKTACGSSLVARRAGKYEATAAISAKIAGIAKNVVVSSGVISNSRLLRYPVRLAATATPSTRPMAVRRERSGLAVDLRPERASSATALSR